MVFLRVGEGVDTHKMVKHTGTICRLLPTNFLSVFDHFVRLLLKRLKMFSSFFVRYKIILKEKLLKQFPSDPMSENPYGGS